MRGKSRSYIGLLVVAFIAIALGGRFLYQNQTRPVISAADSKATPTVAKKSAVPDNQPAAAARQDTVANCITDLSADVEKNKTDYDRGSIIVTFNSSLNFDSAINVLGLYGAKADNEASARQSYAAQALVVAAVPQGSEIAKVCALRRDGSVKYAGLNILFSLHE